MARKASVEKRESYATPHPKFKQVRATNATREWLEGRMKHPTGFCSPYNPVDAQGHEGTRPVSRAGAPLRICDAIETCPCSCHYEIDQMYAMTGLEREPAQQSPEYIAHVEDARMRHSEIMEAVTSDLDTLGVLSALGGIGLPPSGERPATPPPRGADGGVSTPVQGIPVPSFATTPTGRRAKGQLEYDVLGVCTDYVNNVFDWEACTPRNVADRIGKLNAVEPPSTGAINAVWDRWESLGFATQAKKPSRFVEFTGSHGIEDLTRAKLRHKQAKKRTAASDRRGSLRPRGR